MNTRVYLTGFMGSGKSTIGPILAKKLGFTYLDLDEEISRRESADVYDIITLKGEEYFRDAESDALRNIPLDETFVVSLGGGTMTRNGNQDFIKKTGIIVYLEASPEVIYRRIKSNKKRPLYRKKHEHALSREEGMRRIKTLLEKRVPVYENADVIVNTDDMHPELIVEDICEQLTV